MQMEIGTLAQWASATATIFAVLTALFKDEILRCWRRPKLRIHARLAAPDCHKTLIVSTETGGIIAECYYLRLWVENIGKTRAERVQVFVSKLSRQNADNSYGVVENFLPLNLCWAHSQHRNSGPEVFADGISPKMGKHCDLGRVVDPKSRKYLGDDLSQVADDQTILSLDLEVKPNTGSHLVRPGNYQFGLRVAGANCLPVDYTLQVMITGIWFADQGQMFSDGLGMQILT